MTNGDVGEYSSISENQNKFYVDVDVDYIFDVSKPKYPKIKPVYNFKASPSRDGNFKNVQTAKKGDDVQRMIVKQSCLKAAVETLGTKDHKHVLKLAEIYVSWVFGEEQEKKTFKKQIQDKKETTDLPF